MTEETIRKAVSRFAQDTKRLYGKRLEAVILYGSCARGDFEADSDIDVMVLLKIPQEDFIKMLAFGL